jgi:hypothetical protein
MTLSAHQPAYLPYLGYFDKMVRADIFVILDDVQFERNSFINRNLIRVGDEAIWLTVPLKMRGHLGKVIRQMEVIDDNEWVRYHLTKIEEGYEKAPFFWEMPEVVFNHVRHIGYGGIGEINFWAAHILEQEEKCYLQSEIGVHGEKQELVLNLCRHFGADKFLFGALGRDYVDVEYFRANGVEPLFQDFTCPVYPQMGTGFIPNLSVIDALFNVGIEETRKLLNL